MRSIKFTLKACIIAAIVISFFNRIHATEKPTARPTFTATQNDNGHYVVHAVLNPIHTAKLASQMDGLILKLPLREGDAFKKNTLLVGFDCTIKKAELQKAKAILHSAKVTFESSSKLKRLKGLSHVEYAESVAHYREARAEVKSKAHTVKMCSILAPYDGKIVKLDVKRYETVRQSDPLLEILNNSKLQTEFIVPSRWLRWLKIGSIFRLFVTETGKPYQGHVTKIIGRVDAVSQSVKVIGDLDKTHSELIAGMSGQATFLPNTKKR